MKIVAVIASLVLGSASWAQSGRPLTGGRSTMRRVFIVSGCWFILWMTMGVMVSVLFRGVDGLFAGAMNGAWLAVLTSFGATFHWATRNWPNTRRQNKPSSNQSHNAAREISFDPDIRRHYTLRIPSA